MDDLQGTGSPGLQRSRTEKFMMSPRAAAKVEETQREYTADGETNRRSLKDELDIKKVKMLELETENGELKTMIEQMAKEV